MTAVPPSLASASQAQVLELLRNQRNPERAGNQVQLLQQGGQYFPALLRAIDGAQHEIRLETYLFANDAVGAAVCEALRRASLRGVRVRLVLDGFGGKEGIHTWVPALRSAGVWVRIFRPERFHWWPSPHRLRRMHRKIVVIDRRVAFLGGINVIDDFNHDDEQLALAKTPTSPEVQAAPWRAVQTERASSFIDHKLGPRFDFAVQLQGPVVQDIWNANEWLWWQIGPGGKVAESLNTRWWRKRMRQFGQVLANEALNEPPPVCGTSAVQLVLRDNFRFRRNIERSYLQAIGKAHRRLIVANAYFLPSTRFRRALCKASQRGVRVQLLLQGLVEFGFQHYATQALYGELLAHGVEIYEYQRSFLHAKVAVVDGVWCTVGSSNIDPFSLLLAREANVVLRDTEVAKHLQHALSHAMHNESVQVFPQAHAMRPKWHKLRSVVYYLLLRLAVFLAVLKGRY